MAGMNRLQNWLHLLALVLRILLWPLRYVFNVVFPPHELDGLSSAVCRKAALAFTTFLRQDLHLPAEEWSTNGFQSLKEQALSEKSLVLVYLYSPLHRQAQLQAKRLLGDPNFVQFLQQDNILNLGVSIHSAQGAQLAQMLHAACYPVLALLSPSSSNSLQLVFNIQGPALQKARVSELVSRYLSTALTRHQVQLAEREAQRLQREEESLLRRQQDEEYQETLRQDRERQLQREEAEERERAAKEEARLKEEAATRKEQEALEQAKALVKPEPTEGGTRIRFTLPTGQRVERKFASNETTIGALKAFIMLKSMEDNDDEDGILRNVGLSTNYPKKTYEDDDVTLEEAGLAPQAVLMVQNLDA